MLIITHHFSASLYSLDRQATALLHSNPITWHNIYSPPYTYHLTIYFLYFRQMVRRLEMKSHLITTTVVRSKAGEKMQHFPGIWSHIASKNCKYFPPKAKFPGNEMTKFHIFSIHWTGYISIT